MNRSKIIILKVRGGLSVINQFKALVPHFRVNGHIAIICSVHARPANESLDAGHS